MDIKIGIKEENLAGVANAMCKILADEFVLYTKTRKAHWNVEGKDFHSMHLFFEQQYEELDEIVDSVAERIRTLGHYPPASLKEFLALTQLSEQSRTKNDSLGYISELLEDHESILILLRENIKNFDSVWSDLGTSDYITGLLETHEKMAWMLRSHLK
ncbi:DNA starvation/stationary phase protection protein [Flavobacterium sp. LC2016-01]|uniref:Dps family protein n=1 Tax=Flavobacterium sp. LC2016-01 TaxID=2675876 RepID=UPI0012BAB3E9|nr:DNA starvation/stationary phase protection protein [Flavobacterium sp. LC2016-01]MTH18245.1 DNA starvation/stationary phase protection protein [Flavobacterium sp. LC2016-01]